MHPSPAAGVALVVFAHTQRLFLVFLCTAGEGASFQGEEDSCAGGEDAAEGEEAAV